MPHHHHRRSFSAYIDARQPPEWPLPPLIAGSIAQPPALIVAQANPHVLSTGFCRGRMIRAGLEDANIKLASVLDRKSTRLNSSHANISYAVFCLKKKKKKNTYCLQ